MASFARNLNKAPAYLSPCRRPAMPGRTFSNSSELSLASNDSRPAHEFGDVVSSAPGTPLLSPLEGPRTFPPDSPALRSKPSFNSKPITIELPKIKKNTTSAYTPTETLSARGDVPGGYFPLHEDPKTRIHRPHPFQNVHDEQRQKAGDNTTVTMRERASSRDTVSTHSSAHTPVSSYLPSGVSDHVLPVGKYYPSNYERRSQNLLNQRNFVSESVTSYASTDGHGSTYGGGADARQRLQQYQRDMVAQAAMALGGSFKGNPRAGTPGSMAGLPIADLRLTSASPQKPMSPQLVPMGSPGPVTPMELEASGGYLENGKVPSQLSKENIPPKSGDFAPHSL